MSLHASGRRQLTPAWLGLAFVLPAVVVFCLFLALPVLAVSGIAVLKWAGFQLGDWTVVGLDNFARMFRDPVFWRAFGDTLMFTIATTIVLNITGFGYALMVASRVRGSSLAKSALFLPVLISPVIVATIWQFTGYNMLLYYAGLQNLPREQLEAASIDGAGKRATIARIVIPSLYPVIGTAVLLNVIGGLRIFDLIYVMTRGGPNRATEVLATYMYEQAFKISDMGYAAAIAVVIVVLSLAAATARIRWGAALQ